MPTLSARDRNLMLGPHAWLISVALWTGVVATSLYFTLRHTEHSALETATQQGRDVFETMVAMRAWNAESGGVYVPQSSHNPPNPYLDVPERDPVTVSGKRLTMINPAYMTRQMGGIIERESGIRIRITSLRPINPGNKPFDWEAEALRSFENRTVREYSRLIQDAPEPEIRYIAPLYVMQACMACHENQGYQVGDIRGGISVTIPATTLMASINDLKRDDWITHLVSWIIVTLLILAALQQLRKRWLQLDQFNLTLERRVVERTTDLAQESVQRREAELEARGLAERYQQILEASLDGFWLVDERGIIIDVNEAYCRIIGLPASSIRGKSITDFDADDTTLDVAARMERIQEQGGSLFQTHHRKADGTLIDVEVSVAHVPEAHCYTCFLRDITERKRAEERLSLAATVFTNAREGIFITDLDGSIRDVNDSFCQITGYGREEVIGRNPRLFSSGRYDANFYREFWSTLKRKGYWYGEIWNRRKDGSVFAEYLTVSVARDTLGRPTHYIALVTDITEQKEHARQIEQIRNFDTLTGLPNRSLYADRIRQAITFADRSQKLLMVAYLDLDGFRELNEIHGRENGDRVLVELASRLSGLARDGDTIARIGGDEFAALLIDVESVTAGENRLQNMLDSIVRPINIRGEQYSVSASIGASFYPQATPIDGDQLFRQADQAMYQAKLAGKNRFHTFDTARDQEVRGMHASIEEIEKAVAENQLVLHYQPKVNMRTGAVIGAEALIRWNHPTRGFLPPGAFMPVTEDHPVSIMIGEWVIETALTQLEEWNKHAFSVPVSVNISGRHLQCGDFVDRLKASLDRHPTIKPSMLEIEVLETSALSDVAHVSSLIHSCKSMGVEFALDDFGTGYSSLAYLKRLAVSTLKIDQGFVRDMLTDLDDLAILEGVVGLATAFHRGVIAEGVETEEHGVMLLHLGCDLGQGYGIARPMAGADLVAWAATWQTPTSWATSAKFSRDDFPLLAAEIEHKSWVRRLEAYLGGSADIPPPLESSKCRFGLWLESHGSRRYGESAILLGIRDRHQAVHSLAREILAERADHDAPWMDNRLQELKGLSRQIIHDLEWLSREAAQPSIRTVT